MSQKVQSCPEYTFLLINDFHFLFHTILLQFMSCAHFASWLQKIDACGFSLWELFVPVAQHNWSNAGLCHREQYGFSSLAQEQLGKQMLKVSDLEAKNWHCQVCLFLSSILFLTDNENIQLHLKKKRTGSLLVHLKSAYPTPPHFFQLPVFLLILFRNT